MDIKYTQKGKISLWARLGDSSLERRFSQVTFSLASLLNDFIHIAVKPGSLQRVKQVLRLLCLLQALASQLSSASVQFRVICTILKVFSYNKLIV